jgi:hypothetical protein
VEVWNASGVSGAAGKEATALSGLGLTATVAGNAHPTRTHTTVLYGNGASAAATAVAHQLGDVTATSSAAVKSGTVLVYIGTDKGTDIANGTTPSGATSSTSSTTPPPSTASTSSTASDNGENGGTISGNAPGSINGIPCIN